MRKGGRVVRERLSPQSVLRVCEKRAREAGVEGFMPHDLRRTYISTLLDRGADLSMASELAGHASPTTTKRYDRRGERARHEAAATLVVPYVWSRTPAEQGVAIAAYVSGYAPLVDSIGPRGVEERLQLSHLETSRSRGASVVLAAGDYEVVVTNAFIPGPPQEIGRTLFTVPEPSSRLLGLVASSLREEWRVE